MGSAHTAGPHPSTQISDFPASPSGSMTQKRKGQEKNGTVLHKPGSHSQVAHWWDQYSSAQSDGYPIRDIHVFTDIDCLNRFECGRLPTSKLIPEKPTARSIGTQIGFPPGFCCSNGSPYCEVCPMPHTFIEWKDASAYYCLDYDKAVFNPDGIYRVQFKVPGNTQGDCVGLTTSDSDCQLGCLFFPEDGLRCRGTAEFCEYYPCVGPSTVADCDCQMIGIRDEVEMLKSQALYECPRGTWTQVDFKYSTIGEAKRSNDQQRSHNIYKSHVDVVMDGEYIYLKKRPAGDDIVPITLTGYNVTTSVSMTGNSAKIRIPKGVREHGGSISMYVDGIRQKEVQLSVDKASVCDSMTGTNALGHPITTYNCSSGWYKGMMIATLVILVIL